MLKARQLYLRRGGRVAEGGGLLNRYRVKSSIGGSNPPLSASLNKHRQHRHLQPIHMTGNGCDSARSSPFGCTLGCTFERSHRSNRIRIRGLDVTSLRYRDIRVAQHSLNRLVRSSETMKVRCQPSAERMSSVPFQTSSGK
jgi:hypothetical protein